MRAIKRTKAAVMLSLSKHRAGGISARALRQTQDKKALLSLCLVLFGLLISVDALAQSGDSTNKGTSKPIIRSAVDTHPPALIILDGKIYKGDVKQLNPKDIMSVNILKSSSAVPLYGPQGSSGAIVINTKNYKKNAAIEWVKATESAAGDSAVYVVDGAIAYHKLQGIDPEAILSIDVIKKEKAAELFPDGPARNGMVVVVTRAAAIKSYKKKLGAFSKDYNTYLKQQNDDDSFCKYILNGDALKGGRDAIIKKLDAIPAAEIKSVKLQRPRPAESTMEVKVFIITKP